MTPNEQALSDNMHKALGVRRVKHTSEHQRAFIQGHLAHTNKLDGCAVENPYISTSNSSDAFWLGVKAATEGLPTNTPIHKSKGYTWIMGGIKYLVEGSSIRQLEADL